MLHARYAGDHVVHESVVAGDIHETDSMPAQVAVREPEVDRQPAPFFLFQPVRVDAREGTHDRGLAVVDVTGERDDHDRFASVSSSSSSRSAPRMSR